MKTKLVFLLILISISCTSCLKNALKSASKNLIPATQNIEDAAQNIEDATQNIEDVSNNLTEAISQLEGVIEQLGDSGEQLIGSAGTAMQEIIGEFSYSANSVISQVESSSINIIEQSELSAIRVINQLTVSGQKLLNETNKIIRGTVSCIDEAMAKRIAQITDNSFKLLDHIDVLINETIKTVSNEAQEVITVAGQEVSLTVTKSTYNVTSILLLVGALLLLILPLIYFLFKAKKKPLKFKFIVGALFVVPAIFCFVLWNYPGYLWSKLGYAVIVPPLEYAQYCDKSNVEYSNFFKSYDASTSSPKAYMLLGLDVINILNKCSLGNPDDNEVRLKRKMVTELETILFPPPAPVAIDYAVCKDENNKPKKSYHPNIMSKRRNAKAKLLETMISTKQIKKVPYATLAAPLTYNTATIVNQKQFKYADYMKVIAKEQPVAKNIKMVNQIRVMDLSVAKK